MSKPHIIMAETAGFCFGVKRAVQLAFDTETVDETYTLGPIIHNDVVIKRLEDKGIRSVDCIDEASIDTLIIRAHGVGKVVYDQADAKKIRVLDATCPYVRKIHRLVAKYQQDGYSIIVVGDATHPEIIGINGWANNASLILKDKKEAEEAVLDITKDYLLVSQTTYKKEIVDETIAALLEKGITLTAIPTICSATTERQEEAAIIAKKVDAMIVIGSSFSSNTQKLYEICKKHCANTQCILDETELDVECLQGSEIIGITAGASTPGDVIDTVVRRVQGIES